MPNTKSAEKRVNIVEKKYLINKAVKSKISTYTKKFKKLVSEKDFEPAEKAYSELTSLIDSASRKNIVHKNSASRKQAHYAKLLNDAKKA